MRSTTSFVQGSKDVASIGMSPLMNTAALAGAGKIVSAATSSADVRARLHLAVMRFPLLCVIGMPRTTDTDQKLPFRRPRLLYGSRVWENWFRVLPAMARL